MSWTGDADDLMAYASPDASTGVVHVAIEADDHLIAYLTPEDAELHARNILAAASKARALNEGA